jgi:hypothetical protein
MLNTVRVGWELFLREEMDNGLATKVPKPGQIDRQSDILAIVRVGYVMRHLGTF